MEVAKRYQDELQQIKKNIKNSTRENPEPKSSTKSAWKDKGNAIGKAFSSTALEKGQDSIL